MKVLFYRYNSICEPDFISAFKKIGLEVAEITEEMHRLLYNIWKNFPWNDWMYEGMRLGIDKPEN